MTVILSLIAGILSFIYGLLLTLSYYHLPLSFNGQDLGIYRSFWLDAVMLFIALAALAVAFASLFLRRNRTMIIGSKKVLVTISVIAGLAAILIAVNVLWQLTPYLIQLKDFLRQKLGND